MIILPLPPDRAAVVLALALFRVSGGLGSGNFSHAGRPGIVGGSLPNFGSGAFNDRFPPASEDPAPGRFFYYHATDVKNLSFIEQNGLRPNERNHAPISLAPHLESARFWGSEVRGDAVLLRMKRGGIRLERHEPGEYSAMDETAEDATFTHIPPSALQVYHGGTWYNIGTLKTLGGQGSGNFSHSGREGLVGGSTTLFHGTRLDALNSILDEGIRPSFDGFAYATNDLRTAKQYAEVASKRLSEKTKSAAVVLELHVPKGSFQTFDRQDYTVAYFPGKIKPEWIAKVHSQKALRGKWRTLEDFVTLYVPALIAEDGTVTYPMHEIARALGSSSSGNFGHKGRPGQVGGSATAGFVHATAKDATRLKALRIPPAWKNVRLNPDPNGALQAVGEDVKGRTQYRYSAAHSEESAAEKFERLKAFNKVLPSLRERITKDLQSKDPQVREAASVLYLIDKTGFRIGSDQDTKAEKKAFGATTLDAKHVRIEGSTVHFSFVGKKGVQIDKSITDSGLASMLRPRVEAGGRLFQSVDVRAYMAEHAPGHTPKDFRTWHGTAQALTLVSSMPKPTSASALKKAQRAVATAVAEHLGNTPTVALKSYIDPAVFRKWAA